MATLLSNASATGSPVVWGGGLGIFDCAGTFGGATVTLQFLGPDGSTWIAMGSDTTLSAAGGALFTFRPGKIRAAVSGGAPSGLFATAEQQ
jgi:hypothetical protein